MSEKIIAIFGTGRAKPQDAVYKQAETIGKLLAKAGFTIANGGYGGTMLAAAKAASRENGKIIGVTCSEFKNPDGSICAPNQFLTRHITTNSLHQRLDTLINIADAYVVLRGATGTLLELANVWEMKNKRFINPQKPVILVGNFWKPLVELIKIDHPQCTKYIQFAEDPEQVKNILVDEI